LIIIWFIPLLFPYPLTTLSLSARDIIYQISFERASRADNETDNPRAVRFGDFEQNYEAESSSEKLCVAASE